MLKETIQSLVLRPSLLEFTPEDWIKFKTDYAEMYRLDQIVLTNILAAHCGVPVTMINDVMNTAIHEPEYDNHVDVLCQSEKLATLKIQNFQKHSYIRATDLSVLAISRTEWLAVIALFEKQKRHHVTAIFFITSLSSIRKVSYEDLVSQLSKPQPSREVRKRSADEMDEDSSLSRKKHFPFFRRDGGVNPLIVQHNDAEHDLQSRLKETGVRVTHLVPATPEKGYSVLQKTPGNSKVRPVFDINGVTAHKHVTPYSKQPREDRVDTRGASQADITEALPRLQSDRATTVEFTATLATIEQRSGLMRRQSQRAIMRASASEVFIAHGIAIQAKDKRAHHWAHLIAHFLADPKDIISEAPANTATVHFVPSTAAANYNTLEAIELFIRKKLAENKTEQIHIRVTPSYEGEALIPHRLMYDLSWSEINSAGLQEDIAETFYINPQSYHRFNQKMHQSISVLRERAKTADKMITDSDDDEEDDEEISFKPG